MRNLINPLRLFIIFLLIGSTGCLDEINLDIPKGTEETVVIQGKLIKGNPSVIDVSISRLFDFTAAGRDRVAVRKVLLLNESGQSLEVEAASLGNYQLEIPENHPDFSVQTGQSYQLRVVTFDGRTFESTMEPILPTPEPEALRAAFVTKLVEQNPGEFVDKDFIRFFITTPLSVSEGSGGTRLLWKMNKTYQLTDSPLFVQVDPKTCYVTASADIQDVDLFNGLAVNTDRLTDYLLFDEPVGALFAQGYYLNVYQEALSEEAFRYWSAIDDLVERTNSVFESPPGKVRSNFQNVDDPSDETFGYFYATEQKVIRQYVSPEFAGNPTKLCPPNVPPAPGGCPLPPCCDCLDAGDSSTLNKPSYWVE